MIRISNIQEAFAHLVGWEDLQPVFGTIRYPEPTSLKNGIAVQSQTLENAVPGKTYISEDNRTSESGIYFQQLHPLLTLDNLLSIMPVDYENNFYQYSLKQNYPAGTVVTIPEEGATLYVKFTKPVRANSEPEESEYVFTSPLSVWLEGKVKGSISKVINRFMTEKLINKTTNSLLEDKILFMGAGRQEDVIADENKLVGFEIIPARYKGVTVKINRIGVQLDAPSFSIRCGHSGNWGETSTGHFGQILTSSETPINNNTPSWLTPTSDIYLTSEPYFIMPGSDPYNKKAINNQAKYDAGGSWYLYYALNSYKFGRDIKNPINKNIDWSAGPCKTCSRSEYYAWQAWSRYLEIHPFWVDENDVYEKEDYFTGIAYGLWDPAKMHYDYSKNWGLNLDISVYCDLTDFIIQQKLMFADVVAKQVVVDFLREFAYNANVRTNRHSINASKLDILTELDGNAALPYKNGLVYELEQAYKALDISFQGINKVCLPCNNHGIKYRTV